MLLLSCRGASVIAVSSDVTMGDASGPAENATAIMTVLMVVTRLLRDVPKTAQRHTSNATMGNASMPVRNAMEGVNAVMVATNLRPYVGQTVRTFWTGTGLPATMGNASMP